MYKKIIDFLSNDTHLLVTGSLIAILDIIICFIYLRRVITYGNEEKNNYNLDYQPIINEFSEASFLF